MKNYFHNIIWKPAVGVTIIAIAISFLILPTMYACIVSGIMAVMCGLYFFLNRRCQYLFKASGPSSYFQDLGWRNTEAIVVGSTKVWNQINCKEQKIYDATGYKRSNAMNFNMLKTYYSHLREDGTVYYVVDPLEDQKIGDYITPCDFHQIHPHIFLKLGKTYPNPNKYNPLIFDRGYALAFLGAYYARKIKIFGHNNWDVDKEANQLNEGYAKKLAAELDHVLEFCDVRELKCKILIIQSKNAKIKVADYIKHLKKQSVLTVANLNEIRSHISIN